MDDQTSHPASQRVTNAFDASVRDIAEGNLHDAQSVQAEARRMLTDHHRRVRPSLDDGDEAAFNDRLATITWQKPKDEPKLDFTHFSGNAFHFNSLSDTVHFA